MLIKDAKDWEFAKSPEMLFHAICYFEMTDVGYENAKILILALLSTGVDINGDIVIRDLADENGKARERKMSFFLKVCIRNGVPQSFVLWLIEQGADPYKKIGDRTIYSLSSPSLQAAIDTHAAQQKKKRKKSKNKK